MSERMALECMLDIADMQYHNTGDKWWLSLGLEIATKLKRRKHV